MTTGSFGNFSGASSNIIYSLDDVNFGTYFAMPHTGSVNSIFARTVTDTTAWLQCGIYEYAPGSGLKGVTGSVQIDDNPNFNETTFATPIGLPVGSYILCTNSTDGEGLIYPFIDAVANRGGSIADVFPISTSSWTGGSSNFTQNYMMEIYATYDYFEPKTFSGTDVLTLTDIFTTNVIKPKSFSDTLTLTDSFKTQKIFNINISDSISMTDTFTRTGKVTFTKTFSDTITMTDNLDVSSKGIISVSDTITMTDNVNMKLTVNPSRTFSDTITMSDNFNYQYIERGPPKPIKTKLTIEGIEYTPLQMTVNKRMDDFDATSQFIIKIPNDSGKYSSTFNLNDDVIIYADVGATPTTRILRGVVESVRFRGKDESEFIELEGRDYGCILQDIQVSPRIFKNQEASSIVKSLMIQNCNGYGITWNNVANTGIDIDKITFNNTSIFDALKQVAEIVGYYFYMDEDKDLHFVQNDSVSSGKTFDRANVIESDFTNDDSGIYNHVKVYGDRQLTGAQEVFPVQSGSVYTLDDKPSNVVVTGSVYPNNIVIYPGGILNVNDPDDENVRWLVDYDSKQVILADGDTAGYNTGWAGSQAIIIDYQRSSPLISVKQDITSQTTYGRKDKWIIDRNIKSQDEANTRAVTFLAENKDPIVYGKLDVCGICNLTPGNTAIVNIPYHNISYQNYMVLNAMYTFTPENCLKSQVLKVTLNKKVRDFTDLMKEQELRLRALEGTMIDTSVTNVELAIGSVFTEISSYNAISRSIGSAFYFRVPGHDVLCSSSSLIGDMRAGSSVISYP